jgi:hypothetical protein
MRPGLRLPPLDQEGVFLPAWRATAYQVKLNDERGVFVPGQGLFNRQGRHLAGNKAKAFQPAIDEASRTFPNRVLDLALLGYRGTWTPGSVVVLDLMTVQDGKTNYHPFEARYGLLEDRLEAWDPTRRTEPPLVSRLLTYWFTAEQAFDLFHLTRSLPGVEGVIGRDASAPYQPGDSRAMFKSRHS